VFLSLAFGLLLPFSFSSFLPKFPHFALLDDRFCRPRTFFPLFCFRFLSRRASFFHAASFTSLLIAPAIYRLLIVQASHVRISFALLFGYIFSTIPALDSLTDLIFSSQCVLTREYFSFLSFSSMIFFQSVRPTFCSGSFNKLSFFSPFLLPWAPLDSASLFGVAHIVISRASNLLTLFKLVFPLSPRRWTKDFLRLLLLLRTVWNASASFFSTPNPPRDQRRLPLTFL